MNDEDTNGFAFTIYTEFGEENVIPFIPHEYFNLMELVEDKIYEEWGDCKGRAMCGTCHVEVLNGEVGEPDTYEIQKLDELPNKTERSRLACQILTGEELNGKVFKILRDY